MVRLACMLITAFAMVTTMSAGTALAAGDLVVNEVLGDPASDWDGDGSVSASEDEWVEIYNNGAMSMPLDGVRLGDLDQAWAYGFTGILAPGEHIVVYGGESKAWQQANGESAFGHRLSNTGDTVVLWQIAGTDTTMIDSYTYGDHEADDDRSTARRPDGADFWEVFDFLNPYGGTDPPLGNGCAPTPGFSNNCVTPVDPASWGEIKALHR